MLDYRSVVILAPHGHLLFPPIPTLVLSICVCTWTLGHVRHEKHGGRCEANEEKTVGDIKSERNDEKNTGLAKIRQKTQILDLEQHFWTGISRKRHKRGNLTSGTSGYCWNLSFKLLSYLTQN